MTGPSYAAAVREETWIGGRLVESCASHGEARQEGSEILATDRLRDGALRLACEKELAKARAIGNAIRNGRVRIVVRATSDEGTVATLTVTIGGTSIVTTPQHAVEDAAMLERLVSAPPPPSPAPGAPLVWRNGSAAVLLHEAVGHAAEHGHPPLDLPPWLDVRVGFAQRRETFRDVPLQRMTEVVISQHGAPFALPDERIDIELVTGGSYEPLTHTITVDVAVPRLSIRATREQIARSIVGASGDPIRYPGVICSREGQELFVPSYAPVIVTAGLA